MPTNPDLSPHTTVTSSFGTIHAPARIKYSPRRIQRGDDNAPATRK